MKEMKQRRKKERTWAEAARLVLENYSDGPMTPKQILQVIETEGLKEMRSGTSPLACLNAMLHSNSRSCEGLFYKLPGRISLFTLKKDAVQWSRNLSAPEGEELDDTADAESSGSNEASTVSGDNDISLDETSSSASCSTEPQSKNVPAVRESHRATSQASKQKKKTGMMLPRVVLTPLKVNGAHMETSSGFTGRQVGGESSSGTSSALCGGTSVRSRTEIGRDPPQLIRGFRKPTSGQMKRNRGDDIDFETPGSILVNTNLRALINSRTFNVLPLHFQQQLLLLLPEVDRQAGTDGLMRLSGSALNNEFFTHAAQSWRERLADGEFTHEMQVRIRQEMEKEKKTEQWKERFFEDYYGQKLGLTSEEPQQEKAAPVSRENRAASASQEEPPRVQRGPVTRQRDGHLKKRALRCRTRGSLSKLCEAEQVEAAKEASSLEPKSPSQRDTKPEVDLFERSRVPPKSEISPEATRIQSKVEDVMSAAAALGRIPSLSQEPQDQESKEQKRKCFEQAASASFPEKKPRLEDRQSFRNTIESVHPEKPQPTKEEPKVPPIRIQLSRIKPPWVVKGQPAYQICPRIIPNTEPSSQDRNKDPASADFKACAVQGRIQREAASPATAIGGGGGPGGGGRNTDEGGGGGGGGGRIRQPGHRPKCWRSKRARGKCRSDLQRAQLLSFSHLEEETGFELAKVNSYEQEDSSPRAERDVAFGQASLRSEGAAQLAEASGGSCLGGAVAEPSLGHIATEMPVGSSGQLPSDISSEQSPGAASQEGHGRKEGCEFPPSSKQSRSPATLLKGASRMEGHEHGHGLPLNCTSLLKETTSATSSRTVGLESNEEGGLDMVSGSNIEEHLPNPENSSLVGTEELSPQFHMSPSQLTPQQHERGMPRGLHSTSKDEASLSKPVLLSEGLTASHSSCLPPWDMLLRTGVETDREQAKALPSTSPSSDEETRSVLSETTETASDLEAELTDENAELDQEYSRAAEKGADPHRGHLEEYNGSRLESSVRTDSSLCREGLPPEAGATNTCQPQASHLQSACESSLHVVAEGQERPLVVETPKPLSIEASNPLVVQLLKGRQPLQTVLPGTRSSPNRAAAAPSLSKGGSFPVESKCKSSFSQKPSWDKGLDASGTVSNGFCAPGFLRDLPKRQWASGPTPPTMERVEKEPGGLEKSSDSPHQAVGASQKPDKLGPGGAVFSSFTYENPKDSSAAVPAASVAPGNPGEKPKAAGTTSLGPDQSRGGALGKKVFGSGFPCSAAARAQHPRVLEPSPILGMLSHSKLLPPKSGTSGNGVQASREDWPPKQRAHAGGGGGGRGVENKNVLPCSGPAKRNVEKRKEAPPSPAELMEHLQSSPLVGNLPFFKWPRELGKGLAQPLEPSSIPSQLNIKQAFYGKLSKLQLSSAGFNYASSVPGFPKSLAGSMMQLSHKANFAASHGASLSAQMFADGSSMEEISLKCSCSLKAMIMCKGCGAFCHDDCIGPSKLCVLCLVVR